MPMSRKNAVHRKRLTTKAAGFVAVLLSGLLLLSLGRHSLAKASLLNGIHRLTGLEARLAAIHVDLAHTSVRIANLELLNPPGFPEEVMVQIPELFVDVRLRELAKGAVHLEQLRLDIERLSVVRTREQRVNLQPVLARVVPKLKTMASERPQPFLIEELWLSIGTVVFVDYTAHPPLVKEFRVGLNERYRSITNPDAFTGLIVSRALAKTAIGHLAELDVEGLQLAVRETMRQSTASLAGAMVSGVGTASDMGQGALSVVEEAVSVVVDGVKRLFGR